jgi:hypothetical protein
MPQTIKEQVMEEFEEAIEMADGLYNGIIKGETTDGYDNLKSYLKSDKNEFFEEWCYPESPWELKPLLVKNL